MSAGAVALVALKDVVARPRCRLVGPLAGDHQSPAALEARLVPQGDGADVDLEISGAPADGQVGLFSFAR